MLEKILKRSGWTDLVVSFLFILLGILLMVSPETVVSMIALILGGIIILTGILKLMDYFKNNKMDRYTLAIGIICILIGVMILFCANMILSIFRILIAIWILYTGIMNLQTAIVWKDYQSRLWLLSLILSILMIIAGIYTLINTGAILQMIGTVLVGYGILDIIETIIFIKKVDHYVEK